MTITTRSGKGSELTWSEQDNNLTDLRDGVNAMVPKTKGKGIKIGPNGSETFGWHDLTGQLQVYAEPGDASRVIYHGGIKALQFDEGDSAYVDFHLPHDYVPGTDIFIHVHWSHDATTVTGGAVTWGFELMYAKGHNQAPFSEALFVATTQAASILQHQHMIAESVCSVAGGALNLLNTTDLETDGLIQCRLYLDSNDMTVSSGLAPAPFGHMVDIHYQSTNTSTKNRAPDFWA